MPAQYFIRPHLRPGIASIDVYSAVSHKALDKAAPGEEIGFTVNLQEGYSLFSQRAYYANAYGDIIDLVLTRTQIAEYSWNFTMPDSLAVILVEAKGGGGEAVFPMPNTPTSNTALLVRAPDINEVCDYMVSRGYPDIRVTISNWSDIESQIISATNNYQYLYNVRYPAVIGSIPADMETTIFDVRPSITIPATVNVPLIGETIIYLYRRSGSNTLTFVGTALRNEKYYFGIGGDSLAWGRIQVAAIAGYYGQFAYEVYVRYIMSPDNSGDITGPETVDVNTLTFTYRIKTAYEFKRIRAFSVGNVTGTPPVSREESIDSITETYDGDTRTYTFTVSNIPDWAIGVRCVIETIYLPNDENASGTNTSDGPIGGNGTFDDTSDEVPLPAIPAGISAADSGFVTLFRPTITQLKDLGNYLWSNLDEFWENLQKIFTNPMDYIIGLNIFPVSPAVGADKSIYIGNWLTNISMPPVNNQFYEFDCGIRTIDEYFGSFLDYGPNTTARIMLPFIGDRDLAINEIMGKTLHLWYRINLLSGECLAALTINNSVYYQWNGNCAIPIPVTGSDWSRLYGGIGRMVGAGVGLALGGLVGMGIGGAMGAMATAGSGVDYVPFTGVDNQTHYQRVGPHTPYDRASQLAPDPIREPPREEFGLSRPARAALAASTASLVGHNIMGATPRVAHSGDMSGGMSIMGNRTPYIVLEYPKVNLPENYKHLYGYPSNQYAVLGNLSGYTECKAVMFESTTATDDEAELIIRTLKSGVYL